MVCFSNKAVLDVKARDNYSIIQRVFLQALIPTPATAGRMLEALLLIGGEVDLVAASQLCC